MIRILLNLGAVVGFVLLANHVVSNDMSSFDTGCVAIVLVANACTALADAITGIFAPRRADICN